MSNLSSKNIYHIFIINIFIILFLLFYKLIENMSNFNFNYHDCEYLYSSCSNKVLEKVSVDNTIIFTTLSRKFIPQFHNFWLISAVPTKFINILVITYDDESYIFSKKSTQYVLKYNVNVNQTDKDVVYLNRVYTILTRSKIMLCRYFVDLNYSVIVLDTDTTLFKNPLPFMLPIKDFDIIAQAETPYIKDVNNGLMYKIIVIYIDCTEATKE